MPLLNTIMVITLHYLTHPPLSVHYRKVIKTAQCKNKEREGEKTTCYYSLEWHWLQSENHTPHPITQLSYRRERERDSERVAGFIAEVSDSKRVYILTLSIK